MNQDELLHAVQQNPGITQTELRIMFGVYAFDVSEKLYKLRLKRLIYREKDKRTWRIYPTEKHGNKGE